MAVARIDPGRSYTLVSGTQVVPRPGGAVQIGVEPPHWLILHHAPVETMRVLRRLDGSVPVGELLNRHDADPATWLTVLGGLLERGLLVPAADWSFPGIEHSVHLGAERDSLVLRYGTPTARRLLQLRQDALVVVRGSGGVAGAVAGLLTASGVGHVHRQPDGPEAQTVRASAAPAVAASHPASATARTHRPAAHQHPVLTVLATGIPASPWAAAQLLTDSVPHLPIRTQLGSAAVGPLVLPGRSACLLCVLRHRSALDSGWTTVEAGRPPEPETAPAALAAAIAAVATAEALTFIDGLTLPATIDGTVEWCAGELAPRRRSWSVHPDCECRRTGSRAVRG